MNFICERCGYHFESGEKKEKCPYCGEKGLNEAPAAEDLLGEL